ncbi:unnamed protein product [Effrenium voratum]|nr:unnamed protein product [Effrenium voratum]
MDPQLRAIRQAAREKFLQANAPKPSKAAVADSALPEFLAHLPPERLQQSIGSLLADAPPEPPPKRAKPSPDVVVIPKERTEEIQALLRQPAPKEFRVLSWNIDGLDEVGGAQALMQRCLAVAKEVAIQRPAAVLLQEVIPPALELLASPKVLGGTYEVVVPKDPPLPYYVAILLDKQRLRALEPPSTAAFPGTQMGRQLLSVAAKVLDAEAPPVVIATAHLESTKDHGVERKRQLLQCLRFLRSELGRAVSGRVGAAMLGGDLNLRDEEVKAVQKELGDGSGICDAWVACGSPENERWTWDTSANTNIGASFVCKTRFDRLFFLSDWSLSSPKARGMAIASGKAKAKAKAKDLFQRAEAVPCDGWRPTSFALLGKAKVPGLGRFPSDHWGILTSWAWSEAPQAPEPAAATSAEAKAKGFGLKPSDGEGAIDLD